MVVGLNQRGRGILKSRFFGGHLWMAPNIYVLDIFPDELTLWSLRSVLPERAGFWLNFNPLTCRNPFPFSCKVTNRALTGCLNRMICWSPVFPGPLKKPTTEFLLLFFIPARITRSLRRWPQQSLRLITVILVNKVVVESCNRIQGCFRLAERKKPNVFFPREPFHAFLGPHFFLFPRYTFDDQVWTTRIPPETHHKVTKDVVVMEIFFWTSWPIYFMWHLKISKTV